MPLLGSSGHFNCLLLLCFFISNVPAACNFGNTLLSLAVSSGGRSRAAADPVVEFDEFGGLPQLENTYRAISKASTIVAMRCVNGTLLSYSARNSSSLQIPMGAQPLNSLIHPGQYLLITGLAGDARCVIRHAKQTALNYTTAFDSAPTGYYIAQEIGKFLQEYTVRGGMRPLACHIFVADSAKERSLYEIDAAGNVAQIWAGVGGGDMIAGRGILESHLNGTAIYSIKLAEEIAESILQCKRDRINQGGGMQSPSDDVDDNDTNKDGDTFQTVHFVLNDLI